MVVFSEQKADRKASFVPKHPDFKNVEAVRPIVDRKASINLVKSPKTTWTP